MKKIIKLIAIFILLSIINVHAETPIDYERTEANNYGVNKKWKINENNINNVKVTHYVDSSKKIYDYSGILTEDEIESLKTRIDRFKARTNMEFVVVTDSLIYSDDKANQDYAADFYDYNDFGITEEDYSGVLFFRNTYAQDPYYYLLTSGKAQLYFGQDRVDYALDNIYTEISSGEYYDGITELIAYLDRYYTDGIDPDLKGYTIDSTGHLKRPAFRTPWGRVIIIALIFTIAVMVVLIKKNKMILAATEARAYLDNSSVNITHKEDMFLTTRTTSYSTSSSSGGGGGGHSFSGSSGGGHGGGGRHG